jgi:hypothetical protein
MILLMLGAFLPLAVVLTSSSYSNLLNVVFSFALCSLSAFFLAKNIEQPSLRIYDFGFWVFTYVWMGFAPLVQFSLNSFPSTTPGLNLSYAIEAQIIVVLGVFGYLLGFRRSAKTDEVVSRVPFTSPNSMVKVVATCFLFISGLSSFVYVRTVGFSTLFLYRSERRLLITAISEDSLTQTISFTLGWVLSLAAGITFFYVAKSVQNKLYWIAAFAALVPCLVLTNPISTARFVSMTVYGGIALAFAHANGKLPIRSFKIAFVTSIFFLFPILNYFRNNPDSQYVSEVKIDFVSGDYDAFAQIVNTIEYVHRTGSIISDQFLGPILFWLPRQFWVDKPVDTGILLANFKGYSFTNLSASLWTEALISFSPIGLIVCFALVGWMFRKLDDGFDSNSQLIYATFFPGALYSLIILRGSLLQATGGLVLLVISGYIVRILSKKPS